MTTVFYALSKESVTQPWAQATEMWYFLEISFFSGILKSQPMFEYGFK